MRIINLWNITSQGRVWDYNNPTWIVSCAPLPEPCNCKEQLFCCPPCSVFNPPECCLLCSGEMGAADTKFSPLGVVLCLILLSRISPIPASVLGPASIIDASIVQNPGVVLMLKEELGVYSSCTIRLTCCPETTIHSLEANSIVQRP